MRSVKNGDVIGVLKSVGLGGNKTASEGDELKIGKDIDIKDARYFVNSGIAITQAQAEYMARVYSDENDDAAELEAEIIAASAEGEPED